MKRGKLLLALALLGAAAASPSVGSANPSYPLCDTFCQDEISTEPCLCPEWSDKDFEESSCALWNTIYAGGCWYE